VVEEPELPRRLGTAREDVELAKRLTERNRHEATRYLRRLSAQLSARGVRAETRIVTASHATSAIHELSEREQVDMIIACAHGGGASSEHPHGSVAASLALHPTRPLLILQDTIRAACASVHGEAPRRTPIAKTG
jgi:nucleotide-binding universal stress UspA family protein